MALHLPTISALGAWHVRQLVPTVHGWVPDWPAFGASIPGAFLGLLIAFLAQRYSPRLARDSSESDAADGFGNVFVSGVWMGGFDDRNAAARPSWPFAAVCMLAGAGAVGGSLHRYGTHAAGFVAALFCLALGVLATIEIQQRRMPGLAIDALLWGGLIVNVHATFATPQAAIVGAFAGYLIATLPRLLTRQLGKDLVSPGVCKVLAASGAWLGAAALPQIVVGAPVLAVIGIGVFRISGGSGNVARNAFAPYLAVAVALTTLGGVWLNVPYLPTGAAF